LFPLPINITTKLIKRLLNFWKSFGENVHIGRDPGKMKNALKEIKGGRALTSGVGQAPRMFPVTQK
jgi:hypothetical protein